MRKLSSAGRTLRKATGDESGAVLVILAFLCFVFVLLFVGICEFGKLVYVREQTQTAVDAAALAGASTVDWYVQLDVNGTPVTGPKKILLDYGCWTKYAPADGDAWYEVKDWWVQYDTAKSRAKADAYFAMNEPLLASSSGITRMVFHNDRSDPAYPSVTVYGRSTVPLSFPKLFGVFPASYTTDVCAQGQTYYKSINSPDKWTRPPQRTTWKD